MTYCEFHNWVAANQEGQELDFKVGCCKSKAANIAKDIAAFANASGGTLVFGVSDSGELSGCGDFFVENWKSNSQEHNENGIRECLRGHWTHALNFTLEVIDDGPKRFFKLYTPRAGELTGFVSNKNDSKSPIQYWTRVGKQNFAMSHSQILEASEKQILKARRSELQKTFIKHLSSSLMVLHVGVLQLYDHSEFSAEQLTRVEAASLLNHVLPQVVVEAETVFDEIKGLAFLGLDLDLVLKEIVLQLHSQLKGMCKPNSIWRIDSEGLNKMKAGWQSGNQGETHPILHYLNGSNKILSIAVGLRKIAIGYE
jgi:Putative DNA-binding domain